MIEMDCDEMRRRFDIRAAKNNYIQNILSSCLLSKSIQQIFLPKNISKIFIIIIIIIPLIAWLNSLFLPVADY